MVKKSHGPKHKSRNKLKKRVRDRGKVPITRYIQNFDIGESVIIKTEPSVQKGTPYPRFYGKQGFIVEKRGRAYLVEIKDRKKLKKVLCTTVHLKKAD